MKKKSLQPNRGPEAIQLGQFGINWLFKNLRCEIRCGLALVGLAVSNLALDKEVLGFV